MTETKHWTSHAEFIVLLVTLLGGFYLLDGKIERQGERTDRLYEMFCEMRKDYNDKFCEMRKDYNDKFYDLLKERKN